MQRLFTSSVHRTVLLLIAICLAWMTPVAQSTGTARTLYSHQGDGFASFRVDEFGQFTRPSAGRLYFDPLGPFGAQEADFVTTLYLFDQAKTRRTPITDNYWHNYGNCPHGVEPQPSANSHVTMDQSVGTHTRITRFTLPAFPELEVRLTQVAVGERLVQTYAFTNISNGALNLRLARTSDIDMQYTAHYTQNYGGEYPLGSATPYGAVALDRALGIGVVIAAPAGADAIFEGWRVQALSSGGYMHTAVWGNYGFALNAFPGVNGDGINGIWSNPGIFNVNGRCGVTSTDAPIAANFADYYATTPPSDVALTIQSRLDIPPGATRTYITETFGFPAASPCQASTCSSISGAVLVDAGGCSGSQPMANIVVVATHIGSLERYYAVTDAAGNYMILAPFGSYTVGLAQSANQACATSSPTYTLSAALPSTVGVNVYGKVNCDVELFITSSNPSTLVQPGCGIPYRRPCPDQPWRYCFNVLNSGNLPIPANTRFDYGFPSGTSILNISGGLLNCWQPTNNNHVFLQNALAPGANCGFCVDVMVPPIPPISLDVTFATSANARCGPGNQHPVTALETLSDRKSCACDPNQISGYPDGCGPNHVIGHEALTYAIEFDNIGNTPANRVIVVNQFDPNLDLRTFRILQTSHPLTDVRIHPVAGMPGRHEVHFIWNAINLDPIHTNPSAVGRIVYRIDPLAGIPDGSVIENRAHIFFDANPPVQTNTIFHTIVAVPSPLVVFAGPYSVYQGYGTGCALLAPTVTGGMPPYTFAWSNGATTASAQVCPTADISYQVTVTDANGCQAVGEASVTYTDVRCGQNLSKVRVCHNGNDLCISANAVQAHLAGGATLGMCSTSKQGHTPPPPGPGIQLYPNPARHETRVVFASRTKGPVCITLYALDGRQVQVMHDTDTHEDQSHQATLDVRGLDAGIYFVRITDGAGHLGTAKLIVQ